MDLKIKDMLPEHLADATDIWAEGWRDGHAEIVPDELCRLRTRDSFRERLEKHMSRSVVALADQRVAGFCILKDDELYQLYVDRDARGLGVAQALLAEAERRWRAAGITRVWLACAVGNHRAERFYEKTGWENVGATPLELDTSDGPYVLKVWRFERDVGT